MIFRIERPKSSTQFFFFFPPEKPKITQIFPRFTAQNIFTLKKELQKVAGSVHTILSDGLCPAFEITCKSRQLSRMKSSTFQSIHCCLGKNLRCFSFSFRSLCFPCCLFSFCNGSFCFSNCFSSSRSSLLSSHTLHLQ